jgi:hypothetical protein
MRRIVPQHVNWGVVMRIIVAGIIGGVLMFVWGAIAHTRLHIGDIDMKYGTPSEQITAALQAEAPEAGIYMLPTPTKQQMNDEAAVKKHAEQYAGKPYAWIVHMPNGNPGLNNMGPVLGKQLVSDTLSALLLAWVLSLLPAGFGKRVMVAAGMGVFAWLVVQVPLMNWYLFPMGYTLGLGLKFLIGWLIAGAGMAWWLGRGK